MRSSFFLLSILILFLSLKPYSDDKNAGHAENDIITTSHDHQTDFDDTCQLNCSCNCCGGSINIETKRYFSIKKHHKISRSVFSDYTSNYRFDLLSSIWQPPKFIS